MSVIWSGVTEEGAVVPVQVTDEGKVVAVGDGPQGDYLPITGGTLTGDLNVSDGIALSVDGSAQFAGRVDGATFIVGDNPNSGSGTGSCLDDGKVLASRPSGSVFAGYTTGNNTSTAVINANGSAEFTNMITGSRPLISAGSSAFRAAVPNGGKSDKRWFFYGDVAGVSGTSSGWASDGSIKIAGGPADGGIVNEKIALNADGSADFLGLVRARQGVYVEYLTGDATAFYVQNAGFEKVRIKADGSAAFDGDVIIGSRGQQWLIRESNGVAMLVQPSREAAPMIPEKVRDIPSELDLIEMALNEVMEKLRMTPPAGWPVWDGSDNP